MAWPTFLSLHLYDELVREKYIIKQHVYKARFDWSQPVLVPDHPSAGCFIIQSLSGLQVFGWAYPKLSGMLLARGKKSTQNPSLEVRVSRAFLDSRLRVWIRLKDG